MKIMVLMGGESAERAVSLQTGAAVLEALGERGHGVVACDPWAEGATGMSAVRALLDTLEREAPEVAFVALHGGDGEDGTIQALLELARTPYTGSGVMASAIAMDKALSKELFVHCGVTTAPWGIVSAAPGRTSRELLEDAEPIAERLGYPLVVKPNSGGSTVGVSIVEQPDALRRAMNAARRYDERLLLEAFIAGRELTVAVMDGEAFPIVEIVPESGFYDYSAKYTAGKSRYHVPADLQTSVADQLQSLAARAVEVLRCTGGPRVDFRLSPENEPYCLEVNTSPGMTPTSLLPMAANAAGLPFDALVERFCEMALRDHA